MILPRTSTRRRQGGFSLIELMVALVLGLVLIGGVINIFVTNQQAFRTNENLARLQENARISFELTAREIRQAGGKSVWRYIGRQCSDQPCIGLGLQLGRRIGARV